jgi:membrane protein implicated in regulation of membrane protease activity
VTRRLADDSTLADLTLCWLMWALIVAGCAAGPPPVQVCGPLVATAAVAWLWHAAYGAARQFAVAKAESGDDRWN